MRGKSIEVTFEHCGHRGVVIEGRRGFDTCEVCRAHEWHLIVSSLPESERGVFNLPVTDREGEEILESFRQETESRGHPVRERARGLNHQSAWPDLDEKVNGKHSDHK